MKHSTRSIFMVLLFFVSSVALLFCGYLNLTELVFVAVTVFLFIYDRKTEQSIGSWKNGTYTLNSDYVRSQFFKK